MKYIKLFSICIICLMSLFLISCSVKINEENNETIEENNKDEEDSPSNNNEEEHVHNYKQIKMKPTSTMQAYTINVCSCGDSYTDNISGYYKTLDKEKYDGLNILFIGNSYTYYNELWTQFKNVCESNNIKLNVYQVTKGSSQLTLYSDQSNTYGVNVYNYLTSGMDIVFLQEQSNKPISNYEGFVSGAKALNDLIKQNNASSILYETWGRKEGHSYLTTNNMTSYEMYEKLIEAYKKCGSELDIPVSPVGEAFYYVYKNYSDKIELYNDDMTHPSLAGTYLAALVHYASVYGLNPKEITYTAGLDEDVVTILKQAAYDVSFKDYL